MLRALSALNFPPSPSPGAGNSALPNASGYIMAGVGWVPNFYSIYYYPNANSTYPGTAVPYVGVTPDCNSAQGQGVTCCSAPSQNIGCCSQYYYVTVDVTFMGITSATPRIYKTIIYNNCTGQLTPNSVYSYGPVQTCVRGLQQLRRAGAARAAAPPPPNSASLRPRPPSPPVSR